MTLRVVELFAGVGGFRIGLEGPPGTSRDGDFKVVWSNQWEPATLKSQHASDVYTVRWGMEVIEEEKDIIKVTKKVKGKKVEKEVEVTYKTYSSKGINDDIHLNKDIGKVDAKDIPDHDLLVGGFPCQDYSVARTANQATGIEGKKGVLWWEILRILREKRPGMVMLENVDRLLKSPTNQRGRDFAVMLASLSELDYVVEWRVINAADYGMPQRRRRVFILAYGPGTPQHAALSSSDVDVLKWIEEEGVHAKAFPIQPLGVLMAVPNPIKRNDDSDLADVSDEFNLGAKTTAKSPFKESGVMIGNEYYTYPVVPKYDGVFSTLADVLQNPREIAPEYCIEANTVLKEKGWKYLKGAKEEPRKGTGDFTYLYKEGPMIFPDALDNASRTIITGEGGATASRFKHVVKFRPTKKMCEAFELDGDEAQAVRVELGLKKSEWIRRLTPIELERLNMFPDNHTAGPTDGKRAFFMGNALVCGIVQRLGEKIENESGGIPGPSEVISGLISAHLNLDNSNIKLHEGLHLEPMINHKGKMSINAYTMLPWPNAWRKGRRFVNANRQFVGILDFKIIDPNGKMEHDMLLREVMTLLDAEHVRDLYYGKAPCELDLDDEQLVVATNLMCAFIEQEVNWGVQNFQLHTNFGNIEFNRKKCVYLENAVPRDYFCSHILYLFDQMENNPGQSVDHIVDAFLNKWLTGSSNAKKRVIDFPVKNEIVVKSHREFMLSHGDVSVRPWIESHLGEISRVCEVVGKNPRWDRFYEIDCEGNVRIIVDHPLKKKGLDWPVIELK